MKTLVIAPHADDEILGAGGTLFKRNSKNQFNLLALITMPSEPEYEKKFILKREKADKKNYKICKI